MKDLPIIIDGRCDGLLFRDDGVTIDEIKSSVQPLERLEGEGYPVHWAQAKMYAYIYAKDHASRGNLCATDLCPCGNRREKIF